jgi:membrane protease YdiL (CAAX protease family)
MSVRNSPAAVHKRAEASLATVRLSGSEKRALVLWVLAGIVGLWYAHRHFFEAFPEASVNFKVTREEALERSKKFVESLGHDVSGYRTAIIFGVDDNAKVYLERQVGLKEANRLMSSEVHAWAWNVRFFRPQQEEEFAVGINPEGKISGYQHKVPVAKAGGTPSRQEAQKTAQDFLTANLGKAADNWDFLAEEANSEKKPNRTDWSFTWERHGFRAKDAPERLQISLNGDEIGRAHEWLKLPEQWQRDYEHLRATNTFYNQIAVVPYLLVFGAALGLGILFTVRRQTSWLLAVQLGMFVAVFFAAMQLNHWPLDLFGYDTNSAYGSFAIKQVLGAVLFGLGSALTTTLVLPGAEPLYREMRPQFIRLGAAFTLRGIRTKEFFSSTIVGISMAAAHMGFLVAFYLVANRYGAWAPQEMAYDDTVATAIPWITGIAIGLLAATSEEFLFRLFAIPLLKKYTKSTLIAVVLPAFSWGFLHSAYPNEPPYIRGLEVGLIGVVAGLVMLRWGIVATLVWHYTVDASLVGLLLIRSNSWYLRISGVLIGLAVLIPFGLSVYSRLKRGMFEEDSDLLNGPASLDTVERVAAADNLAVETAPTTHPYASLTRSAMGLLALGAMAGAMATYWYKPVRLGDYLKVQIDAKEAAEFAKETLRKRGVALTAYHVVTTFQDLTDGEANEFLRERIGIAGLNDVYEKRVPGALWVVRFFQDGLPEEYAVVLKPDGTLHSIHHVLSEDAKGASLTKEKAQAVAQEFLTDTKQVDLTRWMLVEATTEKKPNRLDHKLVWQEIQPLDTTEPARAGDVANHAYARMQLMVEGDEPTGYRTFVKIPDEWQRRHDEQSVARTILNLAPIFLMLGLGGTVLGFFLRDVRSERMRRIPWKRLAVWGLCGLAAYVLVSAFGNRYAQALSQYKTSIPLKMMQGALGIGFGIGGFFYLGAIVLVFAMGWYFLRQAVGDVELPGWGGMPKDYYRDAFLIGVGGTGALLALSRITEWASMHWPTVRQGLGTGFGTDYDSYLPGISIAATTVLRALLFAGVIATLGGFVAAHCKPAALRAALFVMGSLALVGGWGSPADFAKQWIAKAIFLAVVVYGVTRIARFNLLGYFLVIAIPALLVGAVELLSQPNGFYRQQGYLCVVALLALLAWPGLKWLTARDEKAVATA